VGFSPPLGKGDVATTSTSGSSIAAPGEAACAKPRAIPDSQSAAPSHGNFEKPYARRMMSRP